MQLCIIKVKTFNLKIQTLYGIYIKYFYTHRVNTMNKDTISIDDQVDTDMRI